MSKTFRADFIPHGAYFFGNEKTFSFGKSGRSFISSEQTPAQSTLLGALRYALLYDLEHDGKRLFKADRNYQLNDEEQAVVNALIGTTAFNIDSPTEQYFGAIERLSPLFIYDIVRAKALVPTPKDHKIPGVDEFKDYPDSKDSAANRFFYAPFKPSDFVSNGFEFSVDGCDSGVQRSYCNAFSVKYGLANSYMYVDTGLQVPNDRLFQSVQRVGIAKKKYKSAFFKRACYELQNGFAFSVYVTLRDDVLPPDNAVVFLGQGKTAFSLRFTEETDNIANSIEQLIYPGTVYLLGDSSLSNEVYRYCSFAATGSRDHRTYSVTLSGDVSKGATVWHLVSAGSIYKSNNAEELKKLIEEGASVPSCNQPCMKNLKKIGMNIAIIGKRKEN